MDFSAAFFEIFLIESDKVAPYKSMNIREDNVPWMNEDYISLIHEAKATAQRAKRTKQAEDIMTANLARNRRNILRDIMKKHYFTNEIEENKFKSKKLWKVLNSLLSTKSKKSHI